MAVLLIAVVFFIPLIFGCQKRAAENDPPAPALNGATAETTSASHSLAEALKTVQGSEETWSPCCLFALAVELGIPDQQYREAWPGAKFDALPPVVLATLQQGAAGIPAWIECLKEKQPTGISEGDVWGGGSSGEARKLTCREASLGVLFALAPAGLFKDFPDEEKDPPEDEDRKIQKLATAMSDWAKKLQSLSAGTRLREYYSLANEHQRLRFLAIVVETHYAAAYPLLEESFLKRAAGTDEFLLLEVLAYLRHRREKAAAFFVEFKKELGTHPATEFQDFVLQVGGLLTEYASMEPAIDDYLAGQIGINKLSALVERSIDQPWAYHSLGIESTAVGRPIMEANLRSLIARAEREHTLEKRMALLDIADSAGRTLQTVVGRTKDQERRSRPRSNGPEWQETVKQLSALFADNRISVGEECVTSPADAAAGIVWDLWGPDARTLELPRNSTERDWRSDRVRSYFGSMRGLLVEAAKSFLTNPNDDTLEPFPQEEAARLASGFTTGSAADWRQKMSTLQWDQRLLLQGDAYDDAEFAVRLWPRLLEFVDWQFADDAKPPESFEMLWRDQLLGNKIEEKTWAALVGWIVAEGTAGRWWRVMGESAVTRPGVTLNVFPTPPDADSGEPLPILKTRVRGQPLIMTYVDFRIAANGLERIEEPQETKYPLPKSPTPVDELIRLSQLPATDREVHVQSFVFELQAWPAKK